MNAHDVLAILDTFRVSAGDKQRMQMAEEARMNELAMQSSAARQNALQAHQLGLETPRMLDQQKWDNILDTLVKVNISNGMPPDQAMPAAVRTVNEMRVAAPTADLATARATTARQGVEEDTALGERPGAKAFGSAKMDNQLEQQKLGQETAAGGREYIQGARGGDSMKQAGILESGARIAQALANTSSARTANAVSGARFATAPTRAINEDIAASTGDENKALANTIQHGFVERMTTAKANEDLAGSNFNTKMTLARDPNLAGLASNAQAQEAVDAAALAKEHPALGGTVGKLLGSPFADPKAIGPLLQSLDEILRSKTNSVAPAPAPGQSGVQVRKPTYRGSLD
jgi:hypothetical protein